MTADHFDFFLIVNGSGFDEAGGFVVADPEGDGGDVALVNVALQEEFGVGLADFSLVELEVGVFLVGLAQPDEGGAGFEKLGRGRLLLEEVKELVGGEGASAGGDKAARAGEFDGVAGAFFEVKEGFLFFEPARVAGGAPVGEVLGVNGGGGEFAGEDFFDGGQGVEPGKELGGILAVEEAVVELVADEIRKVGNFADERALFHKLFEF